MARRNSGNISRKRRRQRRSGKHRVPSRGGRFKVSRPWHSTLKAFYKHRKSNPAAYAKYVNNAMRKRIYKSKKTLNSVPDYYGKWESLSGPEQVLWNDLNNPKHASTQTFTHASTQTEPWPVEASSSTSRHSLVPPPPPPPPMSKVTNRSGPKTASEKKGADWKDIAEEVARIAKTKYNLGGGKRPQRHRR